MHGAAPYLGGPLLKWMAASGVCSRALHRAMAFMARMCVHSHRVMTFMLCRRIGIHCPVPRMHIARHRLAGRRFIGLCFGGLSRGIWPKSRKRDKQNNGYYGNRGRASKD
jgi:hypothetical protein